MFWEVVLSDSNFEDEVSADEIWEKISSGNVNKKLEGLIEAASQKANVDQDNAGALVYLDTAKELAESQGDFSGLARICVLLGLTYSRMESWRDAALIHEVGADAAKRGMAFELEVEHLVNAARAYRKLGNISSMKASFDLALELGEQCGYDYQSAVRGEYGRYLRKLGELDRARVLLEQVYQDKPPTPSARAAGELVRLLLATGDVSQALLRAQESFAAAGYTHDVKGMNSSQYLLAQALLANNDAAGALKELNALRERQQWAKVKHKVRVDLLYCEALMRVGEWEQANVLFGSVIPMLRRDGLYAELGKAYHLRAECSGVLDSGVAFGNDMLSSIEAYGQSFAVAEYCQVMLEYANHLVALGDWESAGVYASRIVDQVLMSFTPVYYEALGLFAVASAKAGSAELALDLVSRMDSVSGLALAHKFHASALLGTGVRARNLAVKAVKEYLLLRRDYFLTDLVPLM